MTNSLPYSKYIIIISVLLLTAIDYVACKRKNDSRLDRIAAVVSEMPQTALDSLEAIDYESLSAADRHFHDFLTVKASDKAYIEHTSDSLILDVIDYYSSHGERNVYPEALYYGGRVYSDLGDYPTSLSFFQKAYDELPDNYQDHSLKSRIASQTGRLFIMLRLFSQSVPYLEKAIEENLQNADTVNLAYDYQLLASSFIETGQYDEAELNLRRAAYWARFTDERIMANIKIDMASVKLRKNELDSAAAIIRYLPEQVEPEFRNLALATACDIYMAKGEFDTVCRYAYALAESSDFNNRDNGYRILLSPELRDMIPDDSILSFTRQYNRLLQARFNGHGDQQSLMQISMYNYSVHEKEREKAEKRNRILFAVLSGIVMAAVCTLLIFVYRKYHFAGIHGLSEGCEKKPENTGSEEIKAENDSESGDNGKETEKNRTDQEFISQAEYDENPGNAETENLRKMLKEKVLALGSEERRNITVSEPILKSRAYRKLLSCIESESIISDTDRLWDNLEQAVLSTSREFRKNLVLLTGGNIKKHEYHTAILLKCGVTPMQLAKLSGRSKGAISSRRENLGEKLFGEKVSVDMVDAFIRMM